MVYISLLSIVLIYLALEKVLYRRRLRRIPLRIHVNGTRGKTTVTCLTAELLRRAGIRTLAKTTGDHPVLILPDGRSIPLRRRGPARIHEQMRVVRRAAREGAQAVVLECMALAPQLQEVSEQAMVRSSIGVITNVRPDHFEVMGGGLDGVADALSRTIPNGGALVTESGPYEGLFRERAGARGAAVCVAEAACPLATGSAADPICWKISALVRAVGLTAGLPSAQVDDLLQDMAARAPTGRFVTRARAPGASASSTPFPPTTPFPPPAFRRHFCLRTRWIAPGPFSPSSTRGRTAPFEPLPSRNSSPARRVTRPSSLPGTAASWPAAACVDWVPRHPYSR